MHSVADEPTRSAPQPIRVTAGILVDGGRLLLARRPAGDRLEGMWELPGGKIEAGESPQQCLARELAEECGLVVTVGEFFAESRFHYPHADIRLEAYRIESWSGQLALRAHDAVRWVAADEFDALPIAPADVPILERLRHAIS
jgi:8-oxo-dGTP diphosphatase